MDLWTPLPFHFNRRRIKLTFSKTHTYDLELWRFHRCIEKVHFTSKVKAVSFLKESGWIDMYYDGNCMIYVYVDGQKVFSPSFFKGILEV